MNAKQTACSVSRIEAFLSERLNEEGLYELEQHLAACQACRLAIDDAVASQDDWQAMRTSLAEVSPTASRAGGSADLSSDPGRDQHLAYYRGMLGPTDDPRMLGRIGSYEIAGVLGRGGMGVVFKGFDQGLNRYVAIKLLAPHFASSAAARERFNREARAAAAVVHENVIATHSVATWQGTPYIVMHLVGGESLQQRLAAAGVLQLRETLRIGIQVAAGLAAAHEQGLIHRDVKPANILMESGVDRVVLTDFGLARAVDDIRLTQHDTLIGTPQYMSPEQAADQSLDYRTDLFSLGSVLYECCCGRPAFHAVTSYGVLRKITDHVPTSPREIHPDVPAWFEEILARLMAKGPEDRFQSAAEVEHLLKQCLAHVEQPGLAALPAPIAERSALRVPFLIKGIAMCVLFASCLIGIAALMLPTNWPDASPQESSPFAAEVAEPQPIVVAQRNKRSAENKQKGSSKKEKYSSAKEAFSVGAAFYNARNFKESRAPFEAVLRMTDDEVLRLKAYTALLASYRGLPEFEPYQMAAEYVIAHSERDAERSLTRRGFLSFAYNRGQLDNLIKRYEKTLSKKPNDYLATYVLSEIYRVGDRNPKRAIELLEKLAKLEAAKKPKQQAVTEMSAADKVKVSREKAKLARQYAQSKQYKEAAKLYEEIAPLDPTTHAYHLKEAAMACLLDGNEEEALRLTTAADQAEPETRNDLLAHFFHRHMGDLYLKLGKPEKAVPHYEVAIEKTDIEGYVKDTKASLAEAKEKSE